ncbi:MAG: PilZ domain-containing protein [Myxococcota bacterium]
MSTNRRRDQRVPLSVSFSESDPRTTTPVADLSRTGALVLGGPIHPVGSRIELRFVAFPDDPQPFVHTGRVVRHLTRPDAMGRDLDAMGIEFDSLPQDVAARLDAILERAENEDLRRQRRSKRLMLDPTIDAHDLRTRILIK